MAVLVDVFGFFGLIIFESKTETMCMPIPKPPATKIVAAGQYYYQITSTCLRGAITEAISPSAEIGRWICASLMSFKRFARELYYRPKESLHLKACMVKSEVNDALLHECATWTPLKGHYNKTSSVLHITRSYFEF